MLIISGNNQPFTEVPPSYNARYGFANGAQTEALIVDTSYTASASGSSRSSTASTSSTASSIGSGQGSAASGGLSAPSVRPSSSARVQSSLSSSSLYFILTALGTLGKWTQRQYTLALTRQSTSCPPWSSFTSFEAPLVAFVHTVSIFQQLYL